MLIPFKDGVTQLANCISSLLPYLTSDVTILLVDDGSVDDVYSHPDIKKYLNHTSFRWLRHSKNRGPAAARNTGLSWCYDNTVEIVILLDSDCIAENNIIFAHKKLHRDNPDVVCIGGSIQGVGDSIWARIDGLMSWFTSIPGSDERYVLEPYHLPTTNLSLNLNDLPYSEDIFDHVLRTGEDVLFIKKLRTDGGNVMFSPSPKICHKDRTTFSSFFAHQYRWGLHTYAVRFSGKGNSLLRRVGFSVVFIFAIPIYAVLST